MNIRITLLVAFNILFAFSLSAKIPGVNTPLANKPKPLSFIENKGQIVDKKGDCRNDIDVKLETGTGLTIFVGDGEVHYQWSKVLNQDAPDLSDGSVPHSANTNWQVATYRMDVVLIGANKNAEIITEQQQPYYENYYLAQSSNGAIAHSFNKITYKNIYPNIDWVLYSKGNELKYDFIVHAGGNYRDIKLKYEGATALNIKDGALTATTPFGNITEHKPYCYDAVTKNEVSSRYKIQGNVLSFNVEADDRAIVIDPILMWGTYYGGDFYDGITGIATDGSKNVYIAGTSWSNNIATTSGVHQDTFSGARDGFITQFDETGQRLWSTYYGGTNPDGITAIASDAAGNLFVAGQSSSYAGITKSPCHKQFRDGGSISAFLARFSNTGQLVWGTYYGAGDAEWEQRLAISPDNHVYMVGTIDGDSVATQDGYQPGPGGNEDAFLVKFDYSGNRVWGTFWGTAGDEYGQGVACDRAGNVFITGQTNAGNMVTTPGCHQATSGGSSDAFAVKFDPSGKLMWSTYYGGDEIESANGIHVDNSGDLYFFGMTTSDSAITTPGAFQSVSAGTAGYFTKFTNNGKQLWGTYFAYRVIGLVSDGQRNVYVTGLADHDDTTIVTPDGYKKTFGGGFYDSYLASFTPHGQRLWGTLYGGSENDMVEVISRDDYGNIYIAGSTQSLDNIATTNAFQSTKGNGPYSDGFFTRFLETAVFVDPAFRDSLFCIGNTLSIPVKVYNIFNAGNVFTVQLSDTSGSFANPINIGSVTATSAATVTASLPANTPLSPGYRIRITSSSPVDTSNDNGFDIRIGANPTVAASSNSPVCEGTQLRLTVAVNDPNVTYNWIGPVYVSSFQNVSFDRAALGHAGQHIVTVNAKGCITKDTVEVVVNPKPQFITTSADETLCIGDSLRLTAETDIPAAVYWSATSGFASALASNIIYPASAAHSGEYSVYAVSQKGCFSDTLKREVEVIDLKLKPSASGILYYGDTLHLNTVANPIGTNYQWVGPNGFISTVQNPSIFSVTDKQQGYYYVTASLGGCQVSDSVFQTVLRAKRFSLFPNPNKGSFTIKGRILKDQEVPIEIINYMGQVVYRDHTKAVNYRFERTISLEGGFTNGLYFVRLGIDGTTEDLRFILAR